MIIEPGEMLQKLMFYSILLENTDMSLSVSFWYEVQFSGIPLTNTFHCHFIQKESILNETKKIFTPLFSTWCHFRI